MVGLDTEPVVDPDCRDGKHLACPGWTWAELEDTTAPCECPCHLDKED